MSKVWSFQRWLIAFFMAFLSVSYANASDQVQNQEMAKSKGKILVVMTNHSAYP
ncbi:type 1 glutamine amidotransferase domain-containing protein, partial [Acinetobacter baumannii]